MVPPLSKDLAPTDATDVSAFEEHESVVRVYCRRFPAVFARGSNHRVWDEAGNEYIDMLSGAGVLNYGHNHPTIKAAVVEYLASDGILHSLDLHTTAKRGFIEAFAQSILAPRGLRYKMQFTGPTGTNAVEAAMKIARKATGRASIIAFTNGFHGLSLGALAASANGLKRGAAGVPLTHVTRMPYDGYLGGGIDTLSYLERVLDDPGSGVDTPAAILVETVQGEGGLITASSAWLARLQAIARERGIVLIVDDIQAGCGRTGTFFSFEEAGLEPDIVCLSKSLSGIGLPFALVLLKPELDKQLPGEHSGTFRGNNLAMVGATGALSLWADPSFGEAIRRRARLLESRLGETAQAYASHGCAVRGRGLMRGLVWNDRTVAPRVSRAAFKLRLLVETSGAHGHVLKIMPPLTIPDDELLRGLDILDAALGEVFSTKPS